MHCRQHRIFREREYLLREYENHKRSANDIAKEHGVTPAAIIHWLKRNDISRRSTSESRKIKYWRGPKQLVAVRMTLDFEERREYRRLRLLAFPHLAERARAVCRKWGKANRDYSRRKCREYRIADPERVRGYDRKRRAQKTAYTRERRRTNVNFNISAILRGRIYAALNGKNKSASTLALLGCSVDSFKLYLESKFESGMTWENYGRYPGWQIDHIMPCAIFSLEKPEHQRRCFHFSNMQPMWAAQNISKGCRPVTDQFELI